MDNIVFSKELQGPCDFEDNPPDLILVNSDLGVELFVMNAVHFLSVVVFSFQLVQGIAQRVPTLLIQ